MACGNCIQTVNDTPGCPLCWISKTGFIGNPLCSKRKVCAICSKKVANDGFLCKPKNIRQWK